MSGHTTSIASLLYALFILSMTNFAMGYISYSKGSNLVFRSPNINIKGKVEGVEGHMFRATCIANMNDLKIVPKLMMWKRVTGKEGSIHTMQTIIANFSVEFIIAKLNRSDAGFYKCSMQKADGMWVERQMELHVKHEDDSFGVCGFTRFRCKTSSHCMFNRYMCDGVTDCPLDNTDESFELCGSYPCHGKFMCNNNRCVDQQYICDNSDSCGDNSDELYGCLLNTVISTPKFKIDENDHYDFLRRTVYIVISCVVAIVIVISLFVVINFHMKMSHLRTQRLARLVQQMQQVDNQSSDRDPFLTLSAQPHIGSIIVNVNNGVHCDRTASSEFERHQPPPYSEVAHCTDLPPPPYSTVDKISHCRQINGQPQLSLGEIAALRPLFSHPAHQPYLQQGSSGRYYHGLATTTGTNDHQLSSERNSFINVNQFSTEGSDVCLPSAIPASVAMTSNRLSRSTATSLPPLPPVRTTSIVESEACRFVDDAPLPPCNDLSSVVCTLTVSCLSPSLSWLCSSPPSVGRISRNVKGDLMVHGGMIVISSTPTATCTVPHCSIPTDATASHINDATPSAKSGRLEVLHGQIVLNVPSIEQEGISGERGISCKLDVKDGEISFK